MTPTAAINEAKRRVSTLTKYGYHDWRFTVWDEVAEAYRDVGPREYSMARQARREALIREALIASGQWSRMDAWCEAQADSYGPWQDVVRRILK